MEELLPSVVKALGSISAQTSNTKEFYYFYTLGDGQYGLWTTWGQSHFSLPSSCVCLLYLLILSFLPETYSSQDLFTFLTSSLLFFLPGEMLSGSLDRAMRIRHSFYPIVADSQNSSVHTAVGQGKKECASDG